MWKSSSGSDHPDKPDSDNLSTVSQFFESLVSKQEGSTSVETEDPSTLGNEEKTQTYLYSKTNLATTESLEVLNVSHFPDTATRSSSFRMYLDSRTIHFEEASGQEPETVTAIFREDDKVYPTIGKITEDANTSLEDQFAMSPVLEDENNYTSTPEIISSFKEKSIFTLNSTEDTIATPTVAQEEETVSPTIKGKHEILITIEEETYVAPTQEEPYKKETTAGVLIFEEAPTSEMEWDILPTVVGQTEENEVHETYENKNEIISQTEFEIAFTQAPELQDTPRPTFIQKGEDEILPTPQEGTNISLTLEEGTNISLMVEEGTNIPITLKEGTNISLTPEEGINISQMLKEATNISPTTNISTATENDHNMFPNNEGKTDIYPTTEDDSNLSPSNEGNNTTTSIYSTVEESTNILSTLEGGSNISPTHEGDVNTFPAIEEENNVSSVLEEEIDESSTYVSPVLDDNFGVFPVHSQKSTWALLTTTVGPQQHLNHLEYSTKTSPVTSTTPPGSSSSIKPSAATMRVSSSSLASTTHWSRGSWSPTTPTPKDYRPTTEAQMVTPVIPPVEQGLVDVEFSVTQPPTLHILPNERAVVGNTGRASGNVNATLISLIILSLLLSLMMH